MNFNLFLELWYFRYLTKDGVLMEPCDSDRSCDLDANIFKGIFARNLRYKHTTIKNLVTRNWGIFKRRFLTNSFFLPFNLNICAMIHYPNQAIPVNSCTMWRHNWKSAISILTMTLTPCRQTCMTNIKTVKTYFCW